MAMNHRESIEAVKEAAHKLTLKRIDEHNERREELAAQQAAEDQEATNQTKAVKK